jgi:hypothetical protein
MSIHFGSLLNTSDLNEELIRLKHEFEESKRKIILRITKERLEQSGQYHDSSAKTKESKIFAKIEDGKVVFEESNSESSKEEDCEDEEIEPDDTIDLDGYDFADDPDCTLDEEELTLLDDLENLDNEIDLSIEKILIEEDSIDGHIEEECREGIDLPKGMNWDDFPLNYINWSELVEDKKRDDYYFVKIKSNQMIYYYQD